MTFEYDRVIHYSINEDEIFTILSGIKTGIEYWGKVKIDDAFVKTAQSIKKVVPTLFHSLDDAGSYSSFEIATVINKVFEQDDSIAIISSVENKEFVLTKNDFISAIGNIIECGTWEAFTEDEYDTYNDYCLEENAKYIADAIIQEALFKNENHYIKQLWGLE